MPSKKTPAKKPTPNQCPQCQAIIPADAKLCWLCLEKFTQNDTSQFMNPTLSKAINPRHRILSNIFLTVTLLLVPLTILILIDSSRKDLLYAIPLGLLMIPILLAASMGTAEYRKSIGQVGSMDRILMAITVTTLFLAVAAMAIVILVVAAFVFFFAKCLSEFKGIH